MLVSNEIIIHLEDPRPSVALNLMGLSLIAKYPSYEKKCIFWVDGIFGELFCRYKGVRIEKKRGLTLYTELIEFLSSVKTKRKLAVLGESGGYPRMSRMLFGCTTIVELPYYESELLLSQAQFSLPANIDLVVIGIGSPKQEWIAQKIYEKQRQKVFCFGGALNMYENRERSVSGSILGRYFEWLWRMQNQPGRRIQRMLKSMLPAISVFAKSHLKVRTLSSISEGSDN